jgi:molecular chaperone GrpE
MPEKPRSHDPKAPAAGPEKSERKAPEAGGEPAGAPADSVELERALVESEAAREELVADLKRVAADFDNYRKRIQREQEAMVARAHEKLVEEILPVLDDLERALEAAAMHEEAKLEDGVLLVYRQLRNVLVKEGLEEISAEGEFDPHFHEALAALPSEEREGTILEVVQKGYLLGDRVLRPTRVIVAASPPEE